MINFDMCSLLAQGNNNIYIYIHNMHMITVYKSKCVSIYIYIYVCILKKIDVLASAKGEKISRL